MWIQHKSKVTKSSRLSRLGARFMAGAVTRLHGRLESLGDRVANMQRASTRERVVAERVESRRSPLNRRHETDRPSSIVMLAQLKAQRRQCKAMVAELFTLAFGIAQ